MTTLVASYPTSNAFLIIAVACFFMAAYMLFARLLKMNGKEHPRLGVLMGTAGGLMLFLGGAGLFELVKPFLMG